jgi:predicted nucleic acid-binding protein
MVYLADTNILLRMCDRSSTDHQLCVEAVSRLIQRGDSCHTCAQTLIEFWAVATRPRDANGLGLSPADTLANVLDFRKSMPCLPEPANVIDRWQRLVSEHEIKGRKAHDARIAAFMLEQGLSNILTFNKSDFTRFPQVHAISPSEV